MVSPPAFDGDPGTADAIAAALAQSFMHWGFLAWAVLGSLTAIVLYMGAGQISVLQQFIVITAIPVSLLLLPSLWLGPQAAYAMARQQKLIPPKDDTENSNA